ncbi:MAG: hypothetical protein HY344_03810 [Candidatus Levybacteria bacterium]|nr:hypothetical protein [Candidatus Levybacteria bacterium]
MKISKLKEKLKKSDLHGLALDIDDTLSFTALYWVENLTKKFGNPDNLTASEIINKYKILQRYPHFKNAQAQAWMKKARSTSRVQEFLPLIENSNHIVNKINKIVPIVCYLTIRPERAIEGTRKWLEKHNFPKAPIITRPRYVHYSKGSLWKVKVLKYLFPYVSGIVDDSYSLIANMPNDYKGTVFLYYYHQDMAKKPNHIYCKDWKDVLLKVKERFT